ncbi:MMPL family transporter [Janibacter sp. GXQ6167]|uniref:MMPL family transporter n=1 Tax=Janibacter sp. GXQ6167 TaxID=3240791 RepID=UPI0035241C53
MLDRLTGVVTNRRTAPIVILLALIAVGLVMGVWGQAERTPEIGDQLPKGADSTLAAEMRDQLPEEPGSSALILFTADEGKLTEAQIGQIAQVAQKEGGEQARPIPAEDGTAAFAVIPTESSSASANADEITSLRDRLSDEAPDGVTARVTGPAAVQADLAAVFEGANFRLLGATATVVAILLILTYRSPILWIIPLTVIGTADRVATMVATHVLEAAGSIGVAWDESTTGILSVLVFGAGTNYALLLISRYRDELRRAPETAEGRREALHTALTRAAEAIFASGTTVVVGVITLLLSLTPATRGLGLACAVGISIAVIADLVVLPAVLSLFGRWIFWPKVPHQGQAALTDTRSLWRRVGDTVAKRPPAFVAGTLALLVVLGIGLTQVRLGLPANEQFLRTPEAISAADRLAESFPAGSADPAVIVTKANPEQVTEAAKGVKGVTDVRTTGGANGIAEIQAVLADPPDSDAAERTVGDLRSAVSSFDDTHVGGTTAEAIDIADGAQRDRMLLIPLILALVLGALVLLLRSAVAPVILVATVVGTYLASLGVSWWIFTGISGFSALDDSVPLLSFLFLVALGVDYNIFLVTRAREESREHGPREGMLRALAATGGVITSAGILLAAVFAVLGVLPLVVLAQIGLVICIGVLLDTLIVRTVLVPSIALTLGERFWWPRRIADPEAEPASAE